MSEEEDQKEDLEVRNNKAFCREVITNIKEVKALALKQMETLLKKCKRHSTDFSLESYSRIIKLFIYNTSRVEIAQAALEIYKVLEKEYRDDFSRSRHEEQLKESKID